jgi:hypothetical protein
MLPTDCYELGLLNIEGRPVPPIQTSKPAWGQLSYSRASANAHRRCDALATDSMGANNNRSTVSSSLCLGVPAEAWRKARKFRGEDKVGL